MNIRRWLVVGVVIVVLFAGLALFKYQQIQAAIAMGKSYPEPSATVEVTTSEYSKVEFFATTIGEVIAPQSIELRNEVGGRIVALEMTAGGEVAKGDLLVQLDVSEETAQLHAAQASAKLAKLNLDREEGLIKKRLTSQETVDTARAEYAVAAANVERLKAMIEKKTIRAPFDAYVGLHNLEEGEYLTANTRLVGLVGKNDYRWVDFTMPAEEAVLALGSSINAFVPGIDTPFAATIIASDQALSAQSRNRRYRARAPIAPALVPNLVVNIKVSLGVEESIQLPKTAIVRDKQRAYVFVLQPQQDAAGYRAKRLPVEIGKESENHVVIREGLNSGQLIATHGAFKLREGLLVFTGVGENGQQGQ